MTIVAVDCRVAPMVAPSRRSGAPWSSAVGPCKQGGVDQHIGPSDSGMPGEVVLGRGRSDGGLDWELLYWPEDRHGPQVAYGFIGIGWESHAPSEEFGDVFGLVGISSNSRGLLMNGEVQSTVNRVIVECECETEVEVEATIVDCTSRFGFNYFVAVLLNQAKPVVATSVDGSRAVKAFPR